jgi:hypothetical protein
MGMRLGMLAVSMLAIAACGGQSIDTHSSTYLQGRRDGQKDVAENRALGYPTSPQDKDTAVSVCKPFNGLGPTLTMSKPDAANYLAGCAYQHEHPDSPIP